MLMKEEFEEALEERLKAEYIMDARRFRPASPITTIRIRNMIFKAGAEWAFNELTKKMKKKHE